VVRIGNPMNEQQRPSNELRMDAYYYSFGSTGVPEIDLILSAVACAGKAYHHTEMWNEECEWTPHEGNAPVDWIYNAAAKAAEALKAARAASEPKTAREDRRYVPGDLVFTEGKNAVALECPHVHVMYADGTIERRPLHCTSRNTDAPKGITADMVTKARESLRATVPPKACEVSGCTIPCSTFAHHRRPVGATSSTAVAAKDKINDRVEWTNLIHHTFAGTVLK
jgi:hypothetical protein